MLTKNQKSALIDEASKKLGESQTTIFAEFDGVLTEDFKKLRRDLKKIGADLKVVKKRLLDITLRKAGVGFSPMSVKTQLGTIFFKDELTGVAGLVHKFTKQIAKAKKGTFAVLAAYDAKEKKLMDAAEFKIIAALPSREVLLAQIAVMLTMPIKKLMMTINERSKQAQ